jgi:hypothetical protein
MPGLVPGIHVFGPCRDKKTWMAGTSPAMTGEVVVLNPGRALRSSLRLRGDRRYAARTRVKKVATLVSRSWARADSLAVHVVMSPTA